MHWADVEHVTGTARLNMCGSVNPRLGVCVYSSCRIMLCTGLACAFLGTCMCMGSRAQGTWQPGCLSGCLLQVRSQGEREARMWFEQAPHLAGPRSRPAAR